MSNGEQRLWLLTCGPLSVLAQETDVTETPYFPCGIFSTIEQAMRYIVEIDIGLENAREIVWTMNHPEYFEGYRPDSPKNSYYLICYGVDDQLCDKANGSKTGYSPLSTQEDETYTHEL